MSCSLVQNVVQMIVLLVVQILIQMGHFSGAEEEERALVQSLRYSDSHRERRVGVLHILTGDRIRVGMLH